MLTIEVPDTALEFRKQADVPMSLRLYDDQIAALEKVSSDLGVTRVDLIRRAVDLVIQAAKKKRG